MKIRYLFIIGFIILPFLLFKNISPIFFQYAEFEIKKVVGNIITDAIEEHFVEQNLYNLNIDKNGNIKMADLNSTYSNKLLFDITRSIQNNLKKIEIGESVKLKNKKIDDGIICKIPLFLIFGNKFYINFGPKIPIKINLIGDVSSNLDVDVKDYGINNVLIEVSVIINTSIQMLFPYNNKQIEIDNKTPISLKLIQGNIPNIYTE